MQGLGSGSIPPPRRGRSLLLILLLPLFLCRSVSGYRRGVGVGGMGGFGACSLAFGRRPWGPLLLGGDSSCAERRERSGVEGGHLEEAKWLPDESLWL